jgi:NADH:ubiquinone oxidoreductase subunit 6 (subunit J)
MISPDTRSKWRSVAVSAALGALLAMLLTVQVWYLWQLAILYGAFFGALLAPITHPALHRKRGRTGLLILAIPPGLVAACGGALASDYSMPWVVLSTLVLYALCSAVAYKWAPDESAVPSNGEGVTS